MEKVLYFLRNRSKSCGLACGVGVRVTGQLRTAVSPREEPARAREEGGEGLDTVKSLIRSPAGWSAGNASLLNPMSPECPCPSHLYSSLYSLNHCLCHLSDHGRDRKETTSSLKSTISGGKIPFLSSLLPPTQMKTPLCWSAVPDSYLCN